MPLASRLAQQFCMSNARGPGISYAMTHHGCMMPCDSIQPSTKEALKSLIFEYLFSWCKVARLIYVAGGCRSWQSAKIRLSTPQILNFVVTCESNSTSNMRSSRNRLRAHRNT